ncbi:MAG: HDIG domain-containing protein, partial [Chloroflexi bacterium]
MWLPWERRLQAQLPVIDPAGDDPETNIINFRPPRTIVQEAWRRRAYAVGFALTLFLASLTVLAWQSSPGRTPVKPGDTVVESVRAPRRVTFVSQTRTRIGRDQASAQSPAIYDYDSNLLRQFRGRAADLLRNLSAVKADTLLLPEQRRLMVIRLEAGFSGEAVEAIMSMDDVDWRVTVGEALRVLDENVRERLRAEQIAERRASIIAQISAQLTEPQQVILTDIMTLYLRPNVLVNDVETERVRKEARDRVAPVSVTIEPGEVIVRAGDVITPEDAEKLQALGLGTRAFDALGLAGVSVYGAVIVTLFTVALGSLYGDILLRPRRLALIGVVLVGSMVAARLAIPGQPWVAYAFPSAVAIMLVSNLLDAPLAVLVAVVQAALLAPITGYSFELVILFLAKGIVGAIAARRIDRLNAFFIAGLAVAVTNLAVAFAFRLLSSDLDSQALLNIASGAAVDGVLSAVLTMGSFSLVGSVFGVTTMLQLLELAHPSQPLLRRILTEAPGTYHHSILVGNLAERAAEQIGVDSLLVRVGAYYHDVGKLRRPYYFVENQFDGDNIHHRLSPEASATAIIDHVIHGLELA